MKAVINFFCLAYLFYMWGCDPCNLESKSPNIVIILADDMGYGDFERIGGSTEIGRCKSKTKWVRYS